MTADLKTHRVDMYNGCAFPQRAERNFGGWVDDTGRTY